MTTNPDSIDNFLASFDFEEEEPGQQQEAVKELALAFVTQPVKAHLYLYMIANQRRISLPPLPPPYISKIGNSNLEGFVSECEAELIHRGFRPQSGKQMDGNGKTIAYSFTFDDLSKGFAEEISGLLAHFQKKYPLKPQ
ncbi:hypothetical protein HYV85_00960 [Candidatus Woesearchaeota archaeon]|nr:hypothetical protein [Candidatus Woesearchaeota archaeon]